MKEENYNRACEIKKRLSLLEQHKIDLEKGHFLETHGGLSFCFNDFHSDIRLMCDFISPDFHRDYLNLIEEEIQRLKSEFDNL